MLFLFYLFFQMCGEKNLFCPKSPSLTPTPIFFLSTALGKIEGSRMTPTNSSLLGSCVGSSFGLLAGTAAAALAAFLTATSACFLRTASRLFLCCRRPSFFFSANSSHNLFPFSFLFTFFLLNSFLFLLPFMILMHSALVST